MNTPRYRILSLLYAVCSLAVALAILILSVTPPLDDSGVQVLNSGLLQHLSAYFVLCMFVFLWLETAAAVRVPALCAAAAASLYGLLIECVQFAVPYRTFELSDIVVNCCAAITAAVLGRLITARLRRCSGLCASDNIRIQ